MIGGSDCSETLTNKCRSTETRQCGHALQAPEEGCRTDAAAAARAAGIWGGRHTEHGASIADQHAPGAGVRLEVRAPERCTDGAGGPGGTGPGTTSLVDRNVCRLIASLQRSRVARRTGLGGTGGA